MIPRLRELKQATPISSGEGVEVHMCIDQSIELLQLSWETRVFNRHPDQCHRYSSAVRERESQICLTK